MRTLRPAPRGFTLIEVMVASAISIIVIAGAVTLMLSQQRMYQSSAGERALQETARIAMSELVTNLRRAGYGVDPPLVFDFGRTQQITMSQAPRIAGDVVRVDAPVSCANPVTCRDRIDGPDEVVYYSRNPLFGHQLVSVGGTTTLQVQGPLRAPLFPGQVLLLSCTRDAMSQIYVTVGAYVPPSAAAAPVNVALSAGPGGATLDFPYQQAILGNGTFNGCFTDGTALVNKVDRYRYYVDNFDANGNQVPFLTPGSRPCLMLDQGLTGQDGLPVRTCVVPDVEDLQLGYLFPIGAVPVVGYTAATPIAAGAAGIDLAAASPGYNTPLTDVSRNNQSPANIRGLKLAVVVRSQSPVDANFEATVPAAANRPDIPGLVGFRRMRVETTIPVPNMDSRSPYFTVLSGNNGADQLNVGGG